MNTQLAYPETQPITPPPPEHPAPRVARLSDRQVMLCLAASMALQMTSFVMILPLFARRFAQLGAGVSELGTSEMAYALAATAAAPFMGGLADRFGRRPLLLVSLAVYILAFTGYLLAPSAFVFIVLRTLAGAFTAGMMPAATGMVADLAPADRRAQWIGVISGGASFGWIAGPVLGGLLYDRWGYAVALLAAISIAGLAFLLALGSVRETRTSCALRPAASDSGTARPSLRANLPPLLGPLAAVLFTYFGVMFAWAFIEPRFMFYAYEDLGWKSSMLGLVMSTYGIAMMLGEFGLGRLSDRLGRKPVIVGGLLLFSAQFVGLAFSRDATVIALAFVIAGLGNALFDPALSASVLDLAPAEHRARLLGLKSTVGSVGSIAGPALVVMVGPLLQAQGIFLAASAIVFVIAMVAIGSRQQSAGSPQPVIHSSGPATGDREW
ncbi:MAG: MFS transporter [Anaerolineae bacterium]